MRSIMCHSSCLVLQKLFSRSPFISHRQFPGRSLCWHTAAEDPTAGITAQQADLLSHSSMGKWCSVPARTWLRGSWHTWRWQQPCRVGALGKSHWEPRHGAAHGEWLRDAAATLLSSSTHSWAHSPAAMAEQHFPRSWAECFSQSMVFCSQKEVLASHLKANSCSRMQTVPGKGNKCFSCWGSVWNLLDV